MFDVGFLEILVIGIVSLIVIGPERLPSVARTVGHWVGKAQRFVRGVKSDFASELKSGDLNKIIGDQNDQISELRNIVNNARQELKAGVDEATAVTKSSVDELRQTVENPVDGDDVKDTSPAQTPAQTSGDAPANASGQKAASTPDAKSSESKPASVDADKQSD